MQIIDSSESIVDADEQWDNFSEEIETNPFLKDKDKKFARMVKDKKLDLVKRNGFYEYFNTKTGEAYGANNFSWTAALFIDLINDTKFLSKIGLVDISICEVTN